MTERMDRFEAALQTILEKCQRDPVVVCRSWGDWRRITVEAGCLSGFHITDVAGGTSTPLPRPTLAAYMWCDAIPDGAEFAHSCQHGPGPHRIKVLLFRSHNDRDIYGRLRGLIDTD